MILIVRMMSWGSGGRHARVDSGLGFRVGAPGFDFQKPMQKLTTPPLESAIWNAWDIPKFKAKIDQITASLRPGAS